LSAERERRGRTAQEDVVNGNQEKDFDGRHGRLGGENAPVKKDIQKLKEI